MKILLFCLALIIPNCMMASAESSLPSQVENIDLNIHDHQAVVTFLGLSVGEATLIQGPNGESILVNIGGKGTIRELERWLSLYDVKEISTLMLTNDGSDPSYNDLKKLIDKYNIKEIITTPVILSQLTEQMDQATPIPLHIWKEGTKKELLPELVAEVQFSGNEQNEGMDLLLNFHRHHIFLMTSYSNRSEQTLLKKNLKDIHVLKIPYSIHEKALSDQLIQTLNPEISIFFAADKNQRNEKLLHELHGIWSEVYVPKNHGTVTIKFTKTNYEVITVHGEDEE
ncbi:ComEC/Rec2 family competence protein [Neobacillus jeddahensis]|uniref:hypothetical protein n=1 Tax=Neobacillus jeddahensis TaxID=1461580 RepID=UPI0005A6E143|nr:hypothetical protein [Neobacillus jeddahensis]